MLQASTPFPVAIRSPSLEICPRHSSSVDASARSRARSCTRARVACSCSRSAYTRQFAAVGVISISCTMYSADSGPSLSRRVMGSTGAASRSSARAAWRILRLAGPLMSARSTAARMAGASDSSSSREPTTACSASRRVTTLNPAIRTPPRCRWRRGSPAARPHHASARPGGMWQHTGCADPAPTPRWPSAA